MKQLEEYGAGPEDTIKMYNKLNKELPMADECLSTVKIIPRKIARNEEIKLNPFNKVKQISLKKVPPQQLDLNPSVDSTPRDISVSATSLTSSVSSIFLSPGKLDRMYHNKMNRIKEKVIKSNSELSQDLTNELSDHTLSVGNLKK